MFFYPGDSSWYFQLQPSSNQINNQHQNHHVNAYHHNNPQTTSLPSTNTFQTNQPSLYHGAIGNSNPVNSYNEHSDDSLLNAIFTSFR